MDARRAPLRLRTSNDSCVPTSTLLTLAAAVSHLPHPGEPATLAALRIATHRLLREIVVVFA